MSTKNNIRKNNNPPIEQKGYYKEDWKGLNEYIQENKTILYRGIDNSELIEKAKEYNCYLVPTTPPTTE